MSVLIIEKYFTDEFKNKFSDIFQGGFGCCTKSKATLRLKENSKPVFRPKQAVP